MQHVALSPHHIVLGCNEDHVRLRFDPFEGSSAAGGHVPERTQNRCLDCAAKELQCSSCAAAEQTLQLLPPPSQQQQREGLNGMDGTLPPK